MDLFMQLFGRFVALVDDARCYTHQHQ